MRSAPHVETDASSEGPLPRRSNEFQHLIRVIQSHLDPGASVDESVMWVDPVTHEEREVDVVVRGVVGGHPICVSIECRDRTRRQDVTWVEQMHDVHSRLPTNLLVLVSHKQFTKGARDLAAFYGIRLLVLDDVDATAAERLFPDVQSLWGKAWSVTIQRARISVGEFLGLAAEWFRAAPDSRLYLEDGKEIGTLAEIANAMIRSPLTVQRMATQAQPDHTFLEITWPDPVIDGQRLSVQKLEPRVVRPIDEIVVGANCIVTIDQFPLRHGLIDNLRVAWGSGTLLGEPAMLVATAAENAEPKVSLSLPGTPPSDVRVRG